MINTVIFDMGGTLEDIWSNETTALAARDAVLAVLADHGMAADCTPAVFGERLMSGLADYKRWSEARQLELKPEVIWPDYMLRDFDFDRTRLIGISEQLADLWEVTHFHRELRPHVKETLETLKQRGYCLSVISNTASLYSVFNVLEAYGIRDYFADVTLSSVTGYRKPHPGIFEIALRQVRRTADQCVYVGDTLSRDVLGAKEAGFAQTVQIFSHLTPMKDSGLNEKIRPDHAVGRIDMLTDFLPPLAGA